MQRLLRIGQAVWNVLPTGDNNAFVEGRKDVKALWYAGVTTFATGLFYKYFANGSRLVGGVRQALPLLISYQGIVFVTSWLNSSLVTQEEMRQRLRSVNKCAFLATFGGVLLCLGKGPFTLADAHHVRDLLLLYKRPLMTTGGLVALDQGYSWLALKRLEGKLARAEKEWKTKQAEKDTLVNQEVVEYWKKIPSLVGEVSFLQRWGFLLESRHDILYLQKVIISSDPNAELHREALNQLQWWQSKVAEARKAIEKRRTEEIPPDILDAFSHPELTKMGRECFYKSVEKEIQPLCEFEEWIKKVVTYQNVGDIEKEQDALIQQEQTFASQKKQAKELFDQALRESKTNDQPTTYLDAHLESQKSREDFKALQKVYQVQKKEGAHSFQALKAVWKSVPGDRSHLKAGRVNLMALGFAVLVGATIKVWHDDPFPSSPRFMLGARQALPIVAGYGVTLFVNSFLSQLLFNEEKCYSLTDRLRSVNRGAFLATASMAALCIWKGPFALQDLKNLGTWLFDHKLSVAIGSLFLGTFIYQQSQKVLRVQLAQAEQKLEAKQADKGRVTNESVLKWCQDVRSIQEKREFLEEAQALCTQKQRVLTLQEILLNDSDPNVAEADKHSALGGLHRWSKELAESRAKGQQDLSRTRKQIWNFTFLNVDPSDKELAMTEVARQCKELNSWDQQLFQLEEWFKRVKEYQSFNEIEQERQTLTQEEEQLKTELLAVQESLEKMHAPAVKNEKIEAYLKAQEVYQKARHKVENLDKRISKQSGV